MKDTDPIISFGKEMRKIRTDRKLSQEEFAHLLDLDRTYIGGIERGERNISLGVFFQIAKALGIPPKDLIDF